MRNTGLLLAISMVQLLAAGPIHAGEADEASMEILQATLHANKKALVDVNLGLSDAEAEAFWPLYDRYQAELDAVQTRLLAVIEAYTASFGSTTDEQASQLIDDYLELETDRAAVRRKYLAPIAEVLPGRKVMRFYQIENKVAAVLRYELAATIPVVDQ
jgi:hypothetical protein